MVITDVARAEPFPDNEISVQLGVLLAYLSFLSPLRSGLWKFSALFLAFPSKCRYSAAGWPLLPAGARAPVLDTHARYNFSRAL